MGAETAPDNLIMGRLKPAALEGINGTVHSDDCAHLQMEAFGDNIAPYMLPNYPDVNSVGMRCEAYGYGFFGCPKLDKPFYLKPGAEYKLECDDRDNISANPLTTCRIWLHFRTPRTHLA